jgi:hypothetical protein
MPTPNPYFALQSRIADLLEANGYFTGLSAKKSLLTEKVADLEFEVSNVVVPLGFGVVITTAEGKSVESSYGALLSDEDLNISIVHNPKTVPEKNALEAQWAAIQAVHGQSVLATPPHVATERDFFRVVGHQRRLDAPAGCNVRELHVTGGLRLL